MTIIGQRRDALFVGLSDIGLSPAILVPGRAASFVRYHAGPDRGLRRAGRAEQSALRRGLYALEHLPALAAPWLPGLSYAYIEMTHRVMRGERVLKLQPASRYDADAAPVGVARLEVPHEHLARCRVALGGYRASVLYLDGRAAFLDLARHHERGLQDVQRLEP